MAYEPSKWQAWFFAEMRKEPFFYLVATGNINHAYFLGEQLADRNKYTFIGITPFIN